MAMPWIILVASLITQVGGHTLMQQPIPFPSQLQDNGPMNKDGSNWPCNGEKDFAPNGIMNIWERGSVQHLQAMGGATHGGGSCQISVTYDLKPTVRSAWRVIHSIQGGCPIRNLTETNYGDSATTLLPDIYNFTIPDWLPLGRAVMAWTWYGRWSVPEMFMNCAPIMVLGGRALDTPHTLDISRDDSVLAAKWNQAPLMFEANNGNGCWTANKGSCVEFPEPGESLEVNHECPIDRELLQNPIPFSDFFVVEEQDCMLEVFVDQEKSRPLPVYYGHGQYHMFAVLDMHRLTSMSTLNVDLSLH
ncbi:hypothetical protein J7T55_000217 [Diaporthe amygdali]|uniref:uncharacterized protein n=1 Tax=Phomopsis amygdali TaxID=1214568 RepID=UPI0022FEDF4E|nr:uncharacterized protein J7T55_000217 [Diaporthe amygdali]KAJ0108251.1 hypothetical protein J7T55_000217 [Diaporthe amygdali]